MSPTHKKEKFYKFRTISDDTMTGRRFYNINEPLDLYNREFNIHMTEGIFDLLSLYIHGFIDNKNEKLNNIYIANNGKGYLSALNYIQSLGVLNCNINIYSDNDVKIREIKNRLRNNVIAKFNGLNIYYNDYHKKDKEIKDFGVTKDKIILSSPIPVNF